MEPIKRPDYELADVLELTTPEQFKALGDPVRHKILNLLEERAATTGELATALQSPISTIAHHVRVLVDAGLLKVVQTRQVRAITERYYGCTARTFISVSGDKNSRNNLGLQILQQALKDITSSSQQEQRFQSYSTSYVRISAKKAHVFTERIQQLAEEFEQLNIPGEPIYSLLIALYQTDWPDLPKSLE